MNRKLCLFLLILLFCGEGVLAQGSYTISPYSRYGLGEIQQPAYLHQIGVGGANAADYGYGKFNFLNPATYAYDTLFALEFGMQIQYTAFESNNRRDTKWNSDISYLTFGFPLIRNKLGLNMGFVPFSSTGYAITSYDNSLEAGRVRYEYDGDGGLNRYFIGSGVKLNKEWSLGVNFSYIYGQISQDKRTEFSDAFYFNTRFQQELTVSGLYLEPGLHWKHKLEGDQEISVGLSASLPNDIRAREDVLWENYIINASGNESVRDTVEYKVGDKGRVSLPLGLNSGVSYHRKGKTYSAAFSYQAWSDYEAFATSDSLQDSWRVQAGMSWVPDARSQDFLRRSEYKVGGYYNQSYLNLRENSIDEWALSLGMSLPLRKAYLSQIHMVLEGGQRGTLEDALLREGFLRFSIGLTFNEDWFRKRKID